MIDLNVDDNFNSRCKILRHKVWAKILYFDSNIMLFYEALAYMSNTFFSKIMAPHRIKRLIIEKHLFLVFYMVTNYLSVSYFLSLNIISSLVVKMIFYVLSFHLLMSYLVVQFTDSGYITKNTKIELIMSGKDKRIAENRCNECDVLKCIRSLHCELCNK